MRKNKQWRETLLSYPVFAVLTTGGMPYRMLCNDVKREGAKPSPDLVSGLFCFLPLHNIRYGITGGGIFTAFRYSLTMPLSSLPKSSSLIAPAFHKVR
jgi:hypothetical protein